jgi:ATP-binding cassette subfamily B (MDR/TAP) protein 1
MFVGAIGAGVSVSQMPSISKAKNSARKVFGIIEEKSQIDPRAITNLSDNENKITSGTIVFKNVTFKYPSRNKKILDNLSLTIHGNESVALVGHSGSGKSTIASLLLRFYNKQSGSILIDNKNIESYSVKQLRE